MENIIRGTTPSLILDFADRTEFTVDDIDELVLTISHRCRPFDSCNRTGIEKWFGINPQYVKGVKHEQFSYQCEQHL